jgi:chromate transporter|tara:strand:+ start:9252 stop:10613 length:1362 start_codon:yes stop_codon:yes gene_type:complete
MEIKTQTSTVTPTETATVSRWAAFLYWLKLGFISFGGPAGQISIMFQELVERRRWISEQRFLHALNYTMVLPGPEAQQLATYIGWLMHGTWGGIVAGSLFVLPSLAILITLSWVYLSFGDVPEVIGVLYGIKPAVTAVVAFAAYRIGSRVLKNGLLWGVAATAFIAIFVLNIPFPLIIIGAALLGTLGGRLAPNKFTLGGGHKADSNSFGPAMIDDDTPSPEHARFRWSRVVRFVLIGLLLWVGVLSLLLLNWGWEGTYTQMGWFFSKAAMVTFGGAYAVLPYVYDGGVETFHWLSAPQMMDGLALGEATPGPLIMIVTFVGFLGGWNHAVLGSDSVFLAGAIGATVATFFTFLPSFLFIFIGGPAIEATRHDLKFSAPLSAITAAVVGGIINLALFFAYHVLWPQGFNGQIEWFSAFLGAAAFIALFRFHFNIILVIAVSGAAGLLYTLAVA